MTDKSLIYPKVIKTILWITVIGVGILVYMYYNNIPSIAGIHLNLSGQIDNYGDKSMLVIVWLVTVGINLLYTFDYQFNYVSGAKSLYKRYPLLYHIMATMGVTVLSVFLIARILVN